DALVHAMSLRLPPEFLSSGVGIIVHLLPFQASASGDGTRFPVEVRTRDSPTAMQLVLLMHEIAFSWAPPPRCCGDGMATIVHLLPFQASASVKYTDPRPLAWYQPTAIQFCALVQATSLNCDSKTEPPDAQASAVPSIKASMQPIDATAPIRGRSPRAAIRNPFRAIIIP